MRAPLTRAGTGALAALRTLTGTGALPGRGTRTGYAGRRALAALLPGRKGLANARRLRPTLRGRGPMADADRGVPLGRLRPGGPIVRATWEDVVLAICAPRSGKTTCLAVPAVLDAPGPVVATSNKADLWHSTVRERADRTGAAPWTFDPQAVATDGSPRFVWNPLDGLTDVSQARRLAGHFLAELRRTTGPGTGTDFWDRDAEDLLGALLLAAAVQGRPLARVATWLLSPMAVEPRAALDRGGFAALAGRSQGAPDTRDGVYATARAAAACLTDPQIMAWVTPAPGLPRFDPAAFVRSRETLYLLSSDGAGSAAPLVAAFADRVMIDAIRAAEHSPGGRLDPPLVAVLDEAANVCRITELPRLYSHLGSRGVVPVTILQSRAQGRRVWGTGGMDELFSAATVKVIGAGVDEPAFADDLSRLIGDRDARVVTRHRPARGGGTGTSATTRRERVLPTDQVRALPKFTGLLLVTGARPALVRLVPHVTPGPGWAFRKDTPHSQEIARGHRPVGHSCPP